MGAPNPQLAEEIRQAHTSYAESASQVCKVPPAELVPIIETLAQTFGEPTWADEFAFGPNVGVPLRGDECLDSGLLHWSRTPAAMPLVRRLVQYYGVDEALRIVADDDVDAIRHRDDQLRSLLRSPQFLTNEEMADRLDAFIRGQRRDRQALVSTGYPTEPFDSWPSPLLTNLYPLQYSSVDYDSASDAERLENDRRAMFELKLRLLERLAQAARRRSAVGLWEDCLHLLTDALSAHDVDFYLEADHRRGVALHEAGHLRRTCWWEFLPGGVTEMFAVLGQCEFALMAGTMDSAKRAISEIVDPNARAPYLAILNAPDRDRVDAALDTLDASRFHEAAFWTGYIARVQDALHNDFAVPLPAPKVRRCFAHQFELWLQQLVALGHRHLAQSGTLPEITIPNPEPVFRSRFVQCGKAWLLEFDEYIAPLADSMGIRFLAQLLRHPGEEIHVLNLVRAVMDEPTPATPIAQRPEEDVLKELGTANVGMDSSWPIIDELARKAYQQRIADLEEEIRDAEELGDADTAETRRGEIFDILEELKSTTGPGGRSREWGSAAEKARTNVTKAIKRALKEIEDAHPALASHLACINTGEYCSYKPLGDPPAWEF